MNLFNHFIFSQKMHADFNSKPNGDKDLKNAIIYHCGVCFYPATDNKHYKSLQLDTYIITMDHRSQRKDHKS